MMTGAGVHLLAVLPDLKLVFVHRVDTDHPYNFNQENLNRLFDLIFAARNTEK